MAITTSNMQRSVKVGTGTTHSFNYTATASTSILIVLINLRDGADPPTSISVTYNSVALTLVTGTNAVNTTSDQAMGFYYMLNPPTGSSYSLAASWTLTSSCILSAVCLLGTTGSPFGGTNISNVSTNSHTKTITTIADDMCFDAVFTNSGSSFTEGSGQTVLFTQATANSDMTSEGSYEIATGTSTVMSYTIGSSVNTGYAAFAVRADSGGGGGPIYDGKFFQLF